MVWKCAFMEQYLILAVWHTYVDNWSIYNIYVWQYASENCFFFGMTENTSWLEWINENRLKRNSNSRLDCRQINKTIITLIFGKNIINVDVCVWMYVSAVLFSISISIGFSIKKISISKQTTGILPKESAYIHTGKYTHLMV